MQQEQAEQEEEVQEQAQERAHALLAPTATSAWTRIRTPLFARMFTRAMRPAKGQAQQEQEPAPPGRTPWRDSPPPASASAAPKAAARFGRKVLVALRLGGGSKKASSEDTAAAGARGQAHEGAKAAARAKANWRKGIRGVQFIKTLAQESALSRKRLQHVALASPLHLSVRKRERLVLGARWLLRCAVGGLGACARALHINTIYFSQV
jgi:hypothetical protein